MLPTMELASNALKQHPRWLGVRSAAPSLRLEPSNEKIPGWMSRDVTVFKFWTSVGLGCAFYAAGGKALVAAWIVTVFIAIFAPRALLFWKKKRSTGLRGIFEGLLGMCMAKWRGCRSRRGPRAKGRRRRAVTRTLCSSSSVSSVGCL